jgi:TonB family protein
MEQMPPRAALNVRVEERIDLVFEPKERAGGVTLAIVGSFILHAFLITWAIRNYHPVTASDERKPIVHYVELLRNNPQQRQFTEAPGAKQKAAPRGGLFSDANRKASTPDPQGDRPTQRPGDGSRIYTPPTPAGSRPRDAATQQQVSPSSPSEDQASATERQQSASGLVYHPPVQANAGKVDWRSAIREVGKVASLGGGQQAMDLGNAGGDRGFAESGPLSFETQWFDWGDYAQSMVSRIRVNWYGNMPDLIRTGMKGVVTIRFTIQRSGRITDITILNGSGIPPYDFAAKKALELSSPLNPLPKDFPNDSERVTAMFYYNLEPPNR